MKCRGCEAYGDYGCRAGFTSIVINGELGCKDADRCLDAFHFHQAIDRSVTSAHTHADQLRAKTDEELAGWLSYITGNEQYRDVLPEAWLDWLRTEVEQCEPQSF